MAEKENMLFEYEIKRDKRDFVLDYKSKNPRGRINLKFVAHYLWLENYSKNKNSTIAINGFLKTNHIISGTDFPFLGEHQEYFPLTIYRENKDVSKHAGDIIKLNFESTESAESEFVYNSRRIERNKKAVDDDLKVNGACLYFFDDDGYHFNLYLGTKFNDILDSLLDKSLDFVEFDIFFPNLYRLKETKHRFEYHYRFFDGEFDKGVINYIKIGRNASNKDTVKYLNTSNIWLENSQRIHPVTRKIESVYFTHFPFVMIREIFHIFFGWEKEKDDQRAIRHLLTTIFFLLLIIVIKIW